MIDALRALAVFAKVADLGSFRAAARALSLSPSVVSHHVSELEARLEAPLLYRSTRRLALTPDGEKLVVAARQMVEAAERGLDAVRGSTAAATGALRVTCPAFFAETDFCAGIAAFSTSHPGVELAITFTDAPRDLLRDGLDLAFRIGRLADSTHKTRKLADMHRILVASPRYLAQRRRARVPRDLQGAASIQLSSRPGAYALVSTGGTRRPATVTLAPAVLVDSASAMRELARAGAGIASLPEVLVRDDLARGRLVDVLPGWRPASVAVHAVWPNNAQRPGLTLRFLEAMEPCVSRVFGGPRG